MTEKYCVGCNHYKYIQGRMHNTSAGPYYADEQHLCQHPSLNYGATDLVTGAKDFHKVYCGPERNNLDGMCGVAGKLWEAKP